MSIKLIFAGILIVLLVGFSLAQAGSVPLPL